MKQKGCIALMGSGELTPTMVEVHKQLLSRTGKSPKAFFLDTPAGFQPNVEEISKKAVEYFSHHVQQALGIASLKSFDHTSDYDLTVFYQLIESADYILVGPGSPSYACRQLLPSKVPQIMARLVENGGSLAIASAAALTSGTHTLPVYEIYKVGQSLHWIDGLNILNCFGLDLVVIPHWNNAEGGTHDTRFCFMGKTRLDDLESLLPENSVILGIDEHTACILDCETKTARVDGLGGITLYQKGAQLIFKKGDCIDFETLNNGIQGGAKPLKPVAHPVVHQSESDPARHPSQRFWARVHKAKNQFAHSMETKDFRACVNAILDLDSIVSQANTEFESEGEASISQAREILRDQVVLLGIEAASVQQKNDTLFDLLVDNILKLRASFKKESQWQVADRLRKALEASQIIVEDTKEGSRWRVKNR